MTQIIKVKNGLEFVVLSKLELEGERYLYLSTFDKDMNFVFAKVIDDEYIEPITDGEIISKLLLLIDKQIKEQVSE